MAVTISKTNTQFLFLPASAFVSGRDLKKVGVTIVGPQKKIVSSLKALDSTTKNSPVPV